MLDSYLLWVGFVDSGLLIRDEFLGKLPVEAWAANIKVLLNVGLTMSDGSSGVGVIVLFMVSMLTGVGFLFSKMLNRYLTFFSL